MYLRLFPPDARVRSADIPGRTAGSAEQPDAANGEGPDPVKGGAVVGVTVRPGAAGWLPAAEHPKPTAAITLATAAAITCARTLLLIDAVPAG
jgi:hypothetical protein